MSPSTLLSRPLALVVAALLTAASSSALAQDRPTLSGTWSASGMSEQWAIGDWGEACGPKPAPRGAGGGTVQINESGGELVFSGGGYPRTSGCFEMGGGISVTSHRASPRGWQTRCSTAAGDPRKATIVTTVSASDSSISFDETGQYQFILKDQNCTASVRRSRTYSLVHRQGDSPPAASTSAAPVPTPAPTPTAEVPKAPPEVETPKACASPGDPVRVELRPARKVMKPGETFTPRGLLLDASGCRVPQALTWSTPSPDAKVTVGPGGVVTVAADAAEGEYAILAGVSGKAAKMTVEVVSPERYAELLASGNVNASGENNEVAVAVVATSAMGSSAAVAEDSAKKRKLVFLGVVGAIVAALGAGGLVLMRRHKVEHEEVEEIVPGETKMTVVKKKRLVAKAPGANPMVCPSCKKGYPAGSAFCPNDGTKLEQATVPVAMAPTAAAAPGVGAKVCPSCGLRYGAEAEFCGKEGARLVRAG